MPTGADAATRDTLTGTADSATGTMLAALASSAAFDPKPAVQLVLADEGERHAQALFTATVGGAPVIGIAAAEFARATVLYDNADAFAASFPRLRQALARHDFDIGMSDNSVSEGDAARKYRADAGWRPIITAVAAAGEAPVDGALAQSLADQLSDDTGRPWRIVPAGELK